ITEPSAIFPARSRMRITAYEVTDLPEPDSPTMPSVSPLATDILTCCTALTMPRRVANSTVRSLTSSNGCAVMACSRTSCLRPPLRVNQIAQAIAEQIETDPRDHQRPAGEERDPPLAGNDIGRTFRDHNAPLRRRRLDAEP